MMRVFLIAFALLLPVSASADAPKLREIVEAHILPGYRALAVATAELDTVAVESCVANPAAVEAAFHTAFDAWIGVSHLRFGPSEVEDRAFALAFWPDSRGSTPKTLGALFRGQDAVVDTAEDFATVSIAARGFYALEFLLFDPRFASEANAAYRCRLIKAITRDSAANATAILSDWQNGYGDLLISTGNDTYRTDEEATRQLFTALSTGLEFTSHTRLGRPMGNFDKPRPKRAEAWRSGRSLRHIILSLEANRHFAALISGNDPGVNQAFVAALARAERLDDPIFAKVVEVQGRFEVEVLKQKIDEIRNLLSQGVGPRLGIAAGFNSLDGD